ncbi:MAG: hypothetical protein KUG72_03925 [Pseudomonadales bacterium]|nr:hypothetical protein [Pseudomonadales bacterium]
MVSTESNLYIDLQPSFHLGMKIHISSSGYVAIDYKAYHNKDKPIYSEEIGRQRATTILNKAAELLHMPSDADETIGLDGIEIHIKLNDASLKISKTIWSPGPLHHQNEFVIIKLVYDVLWQLNVPIFLQEQIEQLSCYFELGLPIKIIEENPYVIRFFGRMSASDQQDLNLLLKKIRDDVNLIIDMSNFDGMGTILYPEFKQLLSRGLPIKWIANDRVKEQLLEIGVLESDLHI